MLLERDVAQRHVVEHGEGRGEVLMSCDVAVLVVGDDERVVVTVVVGVVACEDAECVAHVPHGGELLDVPVVVDVEALVLCV